jgi:hypothetical protein
LDIVVLAKIGAGIYLDGAGIFQEGSLYANSFFAGINAQENFSICKLLYDSSQPYSIGN